MSCKETDELLGAYAVDALSEAEAREARAHLKTCRRHDEALAGIGAVVSSLAVAAPEREPAPELRARLLDAFDAEVAARQAPRRIEMVRAGLRWRLAMRPSYVYAVAAVLVLAVAGLLSWNLALQFGGEENGGQETVVASLSGSIGSGRVVYVPDEGVGVLELDLSEPSAGRVYQAWGIVGGAPVSMGLVRAQGVFAFEMELERASAVAITEEPEGGSPKPSSDPLAVAQLP